MEGKIVLKSKGFDRLSLTLTCPTELVEVGLIAGMA